MAILDVIINILIKKLCRIYYKKISKIKNKKNFINSIDSSHYGLSKVRLHWLFHLYKRVTQSIFGLFFFKQYGIKVSRDFYLKLNGD